MWSLPMWRAVWILMVWLVVMPASAQSDRRVALVVGNAAYADRPLRNPGNDAQLMQASLKQLGFDVKVVLDANRRALLDALREFEARARGAEVALFYFAGHGAQVGGANYLLPLGTRIRNATEVADEALEAASVLRRIEASRPKVGLIILDACRDNPYPGAERSAAKGLARMDAPTGTIVAYSTAPGSVADDGRGTHGVYTAALARHLVEPGLDIKEIFDRTAQEVERVTLGRQRPREDVGLRGRFVLRPAMAVEVAAAPVSRPQAGSISVPTAVEGAASGGGTGSGVGAGGTSVPATMGPGTVAGSTAASIAAAGAATAPSAATGAAAFRDCPDCPEMVPLPPGLVRGVTAGPGGSGSAPAFPVAVGAFAIGRYEVTVAEFQRFVSDNPAGSQVPSGDIALGCFSSLDGRWAAQRTWLAPGFAQIPSQPVVCVTWADAQRYVEWLSRKTGQRYRLPSGSEWEYAARARATTVWPWGDRADAICEHANVADLQGMAALKDWRPIGHECDDRHAHTAPAGSYRASGFGVHDMIGNVAEFSSDCEGEGGGAVAAGGTPSVQSPAVQPPVDQAPTAACPRRAVHGGAWVLAGPMTLPAHRFGVTPGFRSDFVGFRVARDLR